jgi:hypothetical protein
MIIFLDIKKYKGNNNIDERWILEANPIMTKKRIAFFFFAQKTA